MTTTPKIRIRLKAYDHKLLDQSAGEIELHECIDRLRGRIHDVQNALVRPDFELLARLLVDVRRAVHRELLDLRRQRDGPPNLGARPTCRRNDLFRRGVEHPMIESLQTDPDILAVHISFPSARSAVRCQTTR